MESRVQSIGLIQIYKMSDTIKGTFWAYMDREETQQCMLSRTNFIDPDQTARLRKLIYASTKDV